MKTLISRESKTNFVLERDVRYLDSRIGLLIAERMAVDKQTEFAHRLEDPEEPKHAVFEDQQLQRYASLFFVLQMEPRHIAMLCRLVSLAEIDSLLQTVMFTLYGNQYEPREEHLLLTMFQVRLWRNTTHTSRCSRRSSNARRISGRSCARTRQCRA